MTRTLLIYVLAACSLGAQTQIPQFQADTLAGEKVTMPGAAHGQPALLVVGFTHASGPQCLAWMKRLKSEFAATAALQQYAVIFLEDAPRLVRPMARSGIKSSVQTKDYGRWLIVTEHEKEMKAAVHFEAPDDAYLVLLRANGEIGWVGHGAVSDDSIGQILNVLKG